MGVLSQLLVKSTDGKRVCCLEIMIPNPAIRNLIRDDKIHQIYSAMQMGQEGSQMQTMNQCLLQHFVKKNLSVETALGITSDASEFESILVKTGI
jgi:twitching motility protein PilT